MNKALALAQNVSQIALWGVVLVRLVPKDNNWSNIHQHCQTLIEDPDQALIRAVRTA